MTPTDTQDFTPPPDGRHDFNFIAGRWLVSNRRLRKCLQGCADWESLEGFQDGALLLGGLGNMNDLVLDGRKPVGMALRFFKPETRQWSIYWMDSNDGVLQPPLFGAFANGIGRFEGAGTYEGQRVKVRLTWSEINQRSARSEQAFSQDGGRHWETNWVMALTRPTYAAARC